MTAATTRAAAICLSPAMRRHASLSLQSDPATMYSFIYPHFPLPLHIPAMFCKCFSYLMNLFANVPSPVSVACSRILTIGFRDLRLFSCSPIPIPIPILISRPTPTPTPITNSWLPTHCPMGPAQRLPIAGMRCSLGTRCRKPALHLQLHDSLMRGGEWPLHQLSPCCCHGPDDALHCLREFYGFSFATPPPESNKSFHCIAPKAQPRFDNAWLTSPITR